MRHVLRDHVHFVVGVEEQLAGERLERETREGIHIGRGGAGVQALRRIAPHLRRRIGCRAAARPNGATSQPKIDEHSRLAAAQDDVGRFEIEVSDADLVHGSEARADLMQHGDSALHVEHAGVDQALEIGALNELHHQDWFWARRQIEGDEVRQAVMWR